MRTPPKSVRRDIFYFYFYFYFYLGSLTVISYATRSSVVRSLASQAELAVFSEVIPTSSFQLLYASLHAHAGIRASS
jgi:hypothetical protein